MLYQVVSVRVMVILQLEIALETFGADFDFLDVRVGRGGGFSLLLDTMQ